MRAILTFILILVFSAARPATAGEIVAARAYQQGNRMIVEYDLTGDPSNVLFAVTYQGRTYTNANLHLEGDVGKDVKPGTGRKIVWNSLQDIPRGVRGEVRWTLNTEKKKSTSASGGWFGFQTRADSGDGVMKFKKGVSFDHKGHMQRLDNCSKCHQGNPGRIDGFGKDYGHRTCKGCHAEMKKGPTSCKDCHKM